MLSDKYPDGVRVFIISHAVTACHLSAKPTNEAACFRRYIVYTVYYYMTYNK